MRAALAAAQLILQAFCQEEPPADLAGRVAKQSAVYFIEEIEKEFE